MTGLPSSIPPGPTGLGTASARIVDALRRGGGPPRPAAAPPPGPVDPVDETVTATTPPSSRTPVHCTR
ncbi:hypothetical protein ABZ942_10300 [Nocardia sp. NPDC046473]|uniref:hypothetical protein n=1 Tax=Nocardia sp. NPDC046473 TaxID=3155733 RepID=UPI0033C5DF11